MSPTERSLKLLKDYGFLVHKVEYWNSFAQLRIDLFGCIDLVAVRNPDMGLIGRIVGIQACSYGDISKRRAKSQDYPAIRSWVLSGGEFIVIGWKDREFRMERAVANKETGTLDFEIQPDFRFVFQ